MWTWKAPVTKLSSGLVLQRCGASGTHCACHSDRQLHRRGVSSSIQDRWGVPSALYEVIATAGQPLESSVRRDMEERFGRDFSTVRVHTETRAAESAAAVDARAYTVGEHVVFGAGNYSPRTSEGDHLLAHELTHVLQQQRGLRSREALSVGAPDTAAEHEAERTADLMAVPDVSRAYFAPTRTAGLIQRQALSNADTDACNEGMADPDLAAQDGSSPVAGLEPVVELSDAQVEAESAFIAGTETPELTPIFLARSPNGRPTPMPKSPAKKTPPKPKSPWITDINVDLAAQELTLHWSDGRVSSPRR